MLNDSIKEAASIIRDAKTVVSLSGAGISVDSGIPDFRSNGGLWAKFDPMVYAHIDSFIQNPQKVWKMLAEMCTIMLGAEPNPGHSALADLEQIGKMSGVITQNIDNLHQVAGNSNVIEFHGNSHRFKCFSCSRQYERLADIPNSDEIPPLCECGAILKPDIVFFGEAIPPQAYKESLMLAETADVMIVVGTSAQVAPANMLPTITRNNGGKLIEVNLERTHLSDVYGALHLEGSTTQVLPKLVERVRELMGC